MTFLCLVLSVISLLAASNAQTLTGCDDCFSSRTRLRFGNIYFGGRQYGAFSVASNGYMVLLSSTSDSIRGYSYNPTSILRAVGSPIIAGFWSDINLACRGTTNTVRYTETRNSGLLWTISSSVQDPAFNPTSAVVVQYDAVQRFTCPSSRENNTFTITVATDRVSRRSYVILEYESMGWNRATSSRNAPVVGYSNGRRQGYQASLTSDPAAYLNANNRLIFRVDQSFTQQVQMNRGNLAALVQEPSYGAVQQQDERKESGPQNVIMQKFEDKQVGSMEEELSLAFKN